jgi:hypothetical protein
LMGKAETSATAAGGSFGQELERLSH